jgi:peptide/nickel transport system substrate-binding protein
MSLIKRNGPRFVLIGLIVIVFVSGFFLFNMSNTTLGSQPNGIFRLATQPLDQTDPAFISADVEIAFANAVYDYLVDVDHNNLIAPRLATDWTTSEDGLTYTFNLAAGVNFHDGSALTPADVVYTFDRLRDPDVGSGAADLYSNVESISANGNSQVIFTLTDTNPFFLFDLADNRAVIVKTGSTDLADFNGTGPFRVVDTEITDQLSMEANPDYFIDGQPGIARLEFIYFSDQIAGIDALLSGQIEGVWRISNTQLESLSSEAGINAINVPTNGFDLVRLRSDRPPGNDPRVVQAIKLATDRNAIWEISQLGLGSVGRDSPIGPLFTSYFSEATPIPARNVAEAQALLADAGFPNGLDLELHFPNISRLEEFSITLQAQWAEAGINVTLLPEPESIYYGEGNWLEVDLGITGWGSRATPQFYFDVMLECGAVWNESQFCDDEFEQLSQLAGSTLDENARIDAYQEMQRILIERAPIIIPYFFAQTAAISNQFSGFNLKAFAGRTDFRTLTQN